jgi:hypothetical protein
LTSIQTFSTRKGMNVGPLLIPSLFASALLASACQPVMKSRTMSDKKTSAAVQDSSEGPSPQAPAALLADFKKVSLCLERVWPGYSWNDFTILARTPEQDQATAMAMKDTQPFEVDLKSFPQAAKTESDFSFFDVNGAPWMSLNFSFGQDGRKSPSMFSLGTHEAFHNRMQTPSWVFPEASRGTEIPLRWEPRIYRAMLELRLREAFQYPEMQGVSLRKARYWYDLWVSQFPNEKMATADGYEGTAEYAQYLSQALLEKSCGASEPELRAEVLRVLAPEPLLLSRAGAMGLDGEGYKIGALASYLLRFDVKTENWEARVAQGETPVDVLLGPLAAIPDEANPPAIERFKKVATEDQRDIDQALAPTLEILRSEGFVMITIPYSWNPGSISYGGFFRDSKSKVDFAILSQGQELHSGMSILKSSPGAVAVRFELSSPCKEAGQSFAVKATEVTADENLADTFQIHGPDIQGVLKAKDTVQEGRHWFCPLE